MFSLIETQYDCLFPLTGDQNGIDHQWNLCLGANLSFEVKNHLCVSPMITHSLTRCFYALGKW